MTAQSKAVIKSYFETGDKPTQAQFVDLVDSYQDVGSSSQNGLVTGGIALNNYYLGTFNSPSTAGTSSIMVANTLYGVPFLVSQSSTFDRVGIQVNTLSAGNGRLGLYNISGGAPTTLVADFGTISTGTTGLKEITINQTLPTGAYLLVAVFNATPSIQRENATGGMREVFGLGVNDSSSNYSHITQSFTYGALNSTFGAVTYVVDSTTTPNIWMRNV